MTIRVVGLLAEASAAIDEVVPLDAELFQRARIRSEWKPSPEFATELAETGSSEER